jgi:hypothetical protein
MRRGSKRAPWGVLAILVVLAGGTTATGCGDSTAQIEAEERADRVFCMRRALEDGLIELSRLVDEGHIREAQETAPVLYSRASIKCDFRESTDYDCDVSAYRGLLEDASYYLAKGFYDEVSNLDEIVYSFGGVHSPCRDW